MDFATFKLSFNHFATQAVMGLCAAVLITLALCAYTYYNECSR